MKKLLAVLLLLSATAAAIAADEVVLGCKRLRLVLDERITAEVLEQEWGSGHERFGKPARLELVGCDARTLASFSLESPLARFDPSPLRGTAHPTFLVTEDLTADMGSYNGPATALIEVVDDRLVQAVAQGSDGRSAPIRLAMTGKAAWQKVAGPKADEFLQVSSYNAASGFVTSYRRYFFAGQQWKVKLRTQKGLWESDAEFPPRAQFPK